MNSHRRLAKNYGCCDNLCECYNEERFKVTLWVSMGTTKFILKKVRFKNTKQDATASFLSAEKRLTI